jgi:5-methylcytosine-specific restriction endonuclease McrA
MKTTKKKVSQPQLLKRAEKIVNEYIRLRDSENGYFTCIACSKVLPVDKMNAGHFIPVSKSSNLRFHPENIWGECEGCNCFDRSHLIGYTLNLIKKIGQERVDWLRANQRIVKKWGKSELESLIDEFKQKLEQLKKAA